jgi:hypothetical protein
MAQIPGSVRLTGFIAPSDTLDTYATQDEMYNRGGYRSVPSADSLTTQYHILVLNAGGYTPCVGGDIGLPVTDDGVPVGTLTNYDNVTFTWWITGAGPWEVALGSVIAITGGTGAGTAAVASIPDPYFITDDRLKQGMLVKALDTGIFWTLTSVPPIRTWVVQAFSGVAEETVRWVGNGEFWADTGVDGGWMAPAACTILAVYAWIAERGVDATPTYSIWDLHQNGVTMYTTQANRPTIASSGGGGETWVLAALPDIVAIAANDRITIDTDQAANGTPYNIGVILGLKKNGNLH